MNKKYFSPELEIRPLFEDILADSEAQVDAGWLEDEEETDE